MIGQSKLFLTVLHRHCGDCVLLFVINLLGVVRTVERTLMHYVKLNEKIIKLLFVGELHVPVSSQWRQHVLARAPPAVHSQALYEVSQGY